MTKDEGGNSLQPSKVDQQGVDKSLDFKEEVLLEQVKSAEYLLSYTFFLIPENPMQQLTDRLANLLAECLAGICESNGWSLDYVMVDPKYIQWILSVHPGTTTMQIVQQVRSKSTERILIDLKEEVSLEAEKDFWAQGYLLLYGKLSHPDTIIDQYIRLIRRQQERK